MGLSNAERQKRWRERQKEKNHAVYKQKERERKKKSYVPHHLLPPDKLDEERVKDRNKARKKYQKQKQRVMVDALPSTSSRPATRSKTEILTVKLPLPSKKTGLQKRYKTALRAAHRKIEILTSRNYELEKSKRRLQKRAQRLLSRKAPGESVNEEASASSPRSKTKLLLKKAGLKLNSKSKVHRQLLLGNTLVESLKESLGQYKRKQSANKRVALDIIKKYRCIDNLSKQIGVGRTKISKLHVRRVSKTIREKYGETVIAFLEREDNSTILPGKRDTKTVHKDVKQKRVLNDYLHNLHSKFEVENPGLRLSLSVFCKLCPPYILLTCFASRRTCLCTYHQNFALKLKTIRSQGVQCSANPDTFIKEFDNDRNVQDALEHHVDAAIEIKYKHWKRVNQGDKFRWKEIEESVTKEDFITVVLQELAAFRKHVKRVQNQYTEMRRLREHLPKDEILIWMDFAENYGCASVEEVQSAYWNVDMVSLHTMVVYSDQQVRSFVAASDVLSHNAATVYCILKKVVPVLKEQHPGLKKIHYLTDSPTSQYRNKTIFQVLCHHIEDFGVSAQWNYLEVGHGKGPCDGLGASVKRSADMAVKQGKCSIQDASDLFLWASKLEGSKVKYILYTDADVKLAEEVLKEKQVPLAIPGTLKLHAVVPVDNTSVAIRDISCCCSSCLTDIRNTKCDGWTIKPIVKQVNAPEKKCHKAKAQHQELDEVSCSRETNTTIKQGATPIVKQVKAQEKKSNKEKSQNQDLDKNMYGLETNTTIKKGAWVAAIYEHDWYLGQVTDDDINEVQINFLTKAGKYSDAYKFPTAPDEIWVNKSDVVLVIEQLRATGKSKRCFKLSDDDRQKIEGAFNQRK